MLTPRPDVEKRIIEAFRSASDNPPPFAELLDPLQYVASANYVVPMLLDLAIKRANDVVEHVPRYSSADHAAIWADLLAAINRFDSFAAPYFDWSLLPDPFAEELLAYEHSKIGRKHLIASFEQDLWRVVEDEEGLRLHLAPRARRSALHLIANKASFLARDDATQTLLRESKPGEDLEEYTLVIGTAELRVFAESCPRAWERLTQALPFPIERVPLFRAFVLALARSGRRWYGRRELGEAWLEYAAARDTASDPAEFEAMLDFHSVSVDEGLTWGVQGALIRFDDFFAVWPFVFHLMHPDLNFLTLLTRRHETLWNETLGSHLAKVADWLANRLSNHTRLLAVARRQRKGVGEADLALLDRATGAVLVLELKTVFDKFRTHIQLTNYTGQRVNFAKAIGQARGAADAIRTGRWQLRDIFGKDAPASPSSVTPGVLTWWDTYNPTLETGDPILCCNFATLEYLLHEAGGAVDDVVRAIGDLSLLYCPGVLLPSGATVDGERIAFRREVQTDVMPPKSSLDQSNVGPLARSVVADLARLPDDWETQPQLDDGPPLFVYSLPTKTD